MQDVREIGNKLHVEGYIYVKCRTRKGRTYWDCRRVRRGECRARAITDDPLDRTKITLIKRTEHQHPPDRDECAAEEVVETLKRKAATRPEVTPAELLRSEMSGLRSEVLSQLPEQEALTRTVRRVRRKHLPTNPRRVTELGPIPEEYQRTLGNERFLLFDSKPEGADSEDEDADGENVDHASSRVLVFATRRNIEILCESSLWFLDGTFDVSPNIFVQVFTILGLRRRNVEEGEGVAVPLVYALLPGKAKEVYATVLRAVRTAVEDYHINICVPQRIVTDFELSIIRACEEVYPGVPVSCCFFHLGQSLYRRVQAEGLQGLYNDPDDHTVRRFVHMMLALAFVPQDEVANAFELLAAEAPEDLQPVLDYFENTYVSGRPARGRRRAVPPRYIPQLWNHHLSALNKSHRTNNCSEGWHNRFNQLVGKSHPDIYTFINEVKKEQAFVESSIAELSLGKKVKISPRRKWLEVQNRIQGIVAQYDTYNDDDNLLLYLRTISYNIHI